MYKENNFDRFRILHVCNIYILYYGVLPKFPFARVMCNVFVGSMEVHNVVGETKPVFFFLTGMVPDKILNYLGQRCHYAFFLHNKVSKLLQKARIGQ